MNLIFKCCDFFVRGCAKLVDFENLLQIQKYFVNYKKLPTNYKKIFLYLINFWNFFDCKFWVNLTFKFCVFSVRGCVKLVDFENSFCTQKSLISYNFFKTYFKTVCLQLVNFSNFSNCKFWVKSILKFSQLEAVLKLQCSGWRKRPCNRMINDFENWIQ